MQWVKKTFDLTITDLWILQEGTWGISWIRCYCHLSAKLFHVNINDKHWTNNLLTANLLITKCLGLKHISPVSLFWDIGKQCSPWSDCWGAVWSGSALFAQICLSENLGSLRYLSDEISVFTPQFLKILVYCTPYWNVSILFLVCDCERTSEQYCGQSGLCTIFHQLLSSDQ